MAHTVQPGTRVRVWDVDAETELGFGVYLGDVAIPENIKEFGKQLFDMDRLDTMPKIRLDSGKELFGYECFWEPVSEAERKDKTS